MSIVQDLLKNLYNINIARDIDEDELRKIGQYVADSVEADDMSRSEWKKEVDQWMALATQIMEKKNTPWPNASNVKYPLLATATVQFHAQAFPALIPSTDIVKAIPKGLDLEGIKEKQAFSVSKHMTYQLREEMPEWEDDTDRLLAVVPMVGVTFKKTYRNDIEDRNVSELVMPHDLIIDYYAKSVELAERKTHVLYQSANDIEERKRSGAYLDIDLKDRPAINKEERGHTPPASDNEATPYTIYECHCWWDLDDDGYKEPYIITVHKDTAQVLCIRAGYTREGVVYEDDETVLRIKQVQYFTAFPFIPNPHSAIYAYGWGHLLGPTNAAVNTLINQLIDAGTLSTLQGGFLGRGARLRRGDMSIRPGEWKNVNISGDDLRKGIFPLPIKEPSMVLFSLLGMLISSGEKLASVSDMMSGELPGQNTKTGVVQAAMMEGRKIFGSIYKRLHRSFGKEFVKLFELNVEHLDDDETYDILDPVSGLPVSITREHYAEAQYMIRPSSDPNIASEQQRVAKSGELLQLAQQGMVNKQEATLRFLRDREHHGLIPLMQVEPEPTPPEVTLEMDKFQHQKEMDYIDRKLAALKTQNQAMRDEAAAMKTLVEAGILEEKMELDKVKAHLDSLEKDRADNEAQMQNILNYISKAESDKVQGQENKENVSPT